MKAVELAVDRKDCCCNIDTVNFNLRGLPALTSGSFNPTSVSWVQAKQQYNQPGPDWYLPLNIIRTSGGLKHSTSVKLVIQ
jgi:hypothetical protein